jgi:hypothetical protein|tara:strand:- start:7542 stop:7793 length:252 start_codon:yes stop_codon:yes gene_type:complete
MRKIYLTKNEWVRSIIDKYCSIEDDMSSPNELLDLVILLMEIIDSFQIEITKLPSSDGIHYVDVKQKREGTYEIEEFSTLEEL